MDCVAESREGVTSSFVDKSVGISETRFDILTI